MNRTLVTIQTIKELTPIKDADAIEVATVLGWHCVVKKDEFKVGDRILYFEVDSLLPIIPEFEFMSKNGTKTILVDQKEVTGYRLKTIRLRGQISQGLVMPLSLLKKVGVASSALAEEIFNNIKNIEDGVDVSELLGVFKYEAPISASLAGIAKGVFPSFIPKTDEPRVQGLRSNILDQYKDLDYYVTEKIDGTSMTVFYKNNELNVCGRNINLKDAEDNALWKTAKALDLENKLKGKNIALQGELFGEKIQGNKLKITGHKFMIFNIYDFQENVYLDYENFIKTAKELGVETVPIIDDKFKLKSIDELVSYATIKSTINPNVWTEGIVIRPLKEVNDIQLGRLSFKVINPEFLLFYKE